MTEFKMPPRDRSPGLMPSPRTEEPEYPTTITSLIVQIAALRGCVEKLEAERDAALARANRAEALNKLNKLPAFEETLLMTTEPPVPAEDQLVALRQAMGVLRDVINRSLDPGLVRNDLVRSSEDLLELVEALICDLAFECTASKRAEAEVEFHRLRAEAAEARESVWRLGCDAAIAGAEKVEAAFARCKIERDRARVFLRERLLIARTEGVVFVGADAVLADEPEEK